eukprot:3002426-Pyramimonas_sp.AAC.1
MCHTHGPLRALRVMIVSHPQVKESVVAWLDGLGSPFEQSRENVGRLVAHRPDLTEWLLKVSNSRVYEMNSHVSEVNARMGLAHSQGLAW